MKDLQKHYEYCVELLRSLGDEYDPSEYVKYITVNNRITRVLGRAYTPKKKKNAKPNCCYIEISSLAVQDEVDDKTLNSIIIHECLHCLPQCYEAKHTGTWKQYAQIVSYRLKDYGIVIKRTEQLNDNFKSSDEYKKVQAKKKKQSLFIHTLNCGCGEIIGSVASAHFSRFSSGRYWFTCPKCGKKLTFQNYEKLEFTKKNYDYVLEHSTPKKIYGHQVSPEK